MKEQRLGTPLFNIKALSMNPSVSPLDLRMGTQGQAFPQCVRSLATHVRISSRSHQQGQRHRQGCSKRKGLAEDIPLSIVSSIVCKRVLFSIALVLDLNFLRCNLN